MNSGVESGPFWVKARLAVRPRGTFCVFPTPGVEPQDTGLLGDLISCKIVYIDKVMALEKPQILAATKRILIDLEEQHRVWEVKSEEMEQMILSGQVRNLWSLVASNILYVYGWTKFRKKARSSLH